MLAGAVGKGMLRRGWQAYSGALKSHPLRTNLATSGVLTVASDLVAQVLTFEKKCFSNFRGNWQGTVRRVWGDCRMEHAPTPRWGTLVEEAPPACLIHSEECVEPFYAFRTTTLKVGPNG